MIHVEFYGAPIEDFRIFQLGVGFSPFLGNRPDALFFSSQPALTQSTEAKRTIFSNRRPPDS